MQQDGGVGKRAHDTPQSVRKLSRLKTALLWIQGVILALALLSQLAYAHLPYQTYSVLTPILLRIASVIFLASTPLLAASLWTLRKLIPQDAYWGFFFMIVGTSALLSAVAVFVFLSTFQPALFQPPPFVVGVFAVMGVGLLLILFGLLLVFVELIRKFARLVRDKQQAHISNRQ